MNLTGISFVDCEFDWCNFESSELNKVSFSGCKLINVNMMAARLKNCYFSQCEFEEVMCVGTQFRNTRIECSSLVSCSFEDASLEDFEFESCAMPATHFLNAQIQNSKITKSNLRDVVFFGCLTEFDADKSSLDSAQITAPVSAILVSPQHRGISTPKAFMALDQKSHVIPLRISMQSPTVDGAKVTHEVDHILQNIKASETPIAQQLLKQASEDPKGYPSMDTILKKVALMSSEVDSFFLPGGEDAPPALYGEEADEHTEWGGDYTRSVLELAMIQASYRKGIPLMAVCRGFQMSNIYFGAHLKQHIVGHKGIQKFSLQEREHQGLYREAMKRTIMGAVFHHQAVPEEKAATEHLEPAVIYDGLVKAAEPRMGGSSPMVLLQFHPEFLGMTTAHSWKRELIDTGLTLAMSKDNEKFWKILGDSAATYRNKQRVLQEIRKGGDALKRGLKGPDGSSSSAVTEPEA